MTKRILVLEDDKTLAFIYMMFLEDIGYKDVLLFESAEEALAQIESINPDIALVDISLSGKMQGIEFATVLQSEYDVPVIYITGHTEDNIVQKAIRSNSYGYLIKPIDKNMLSVGLELALAKYKNDKEIGIEKLVVNKIDTGIVVSNQNGDFIFSNEAVKKLLSIPKNYQKKKVSEYIFGNEFTFDENFIKKVIIGKLESFEFYRNDINKNFLIKFQTIKEPAKEQTLIFSFIYDITETKNIEDKQRFLDYSLRTIFDTSKDATFIVDRNFLLVDFNETAVSYSDEFWGVNLVKGKDIFKSFPALQQYEIKEFEKLLNNSFDGITHYLDRIFEINGKKKYFKINIFPIFSGSKHTISLVGISWFDNTYEVELEQELEEIKTEIKPLFDSSFQRFYLTDLQYRVVAFNKAAEETIFKEFNHILKKGDSVLNFVPKEMEIDDFREKFKQALNYEHVSFKLMISSPTGEYWNETHLDPVLNAKGEITRILIWTIDITEQEKNIQALQESQERYSLIANGANDGLWDWDIRSGKVYLSPRWKNLLGYEDDELPNKFGVHDNLIHPDDKERCDEELQKYINNEIDIYSVEIRLKHKSGKYIWVLERGFAQRDENGKVIRVAGSITDITRQKIIEEKLRKVNKQLLEERNMFMSGDLLVYRWIVKDDKITVKYFTENIINILGYTNLDFVSGNIQLEDVIFPEDKIIFYQDIEKVKQQNISNFEFSPIRLIKKNGKYIWIKNFASITDKNSTQLELLGYFIDLSSLIDAKPMMNEKQKKIIDFFLNTSEPIVGVQNNIVVESNKPAQALFGFDEKSFRKKTISDIFYSENESAISRFQRKLKEDKKEIIYWKCIRSDKTMFDAEISFNPVKHESGMVIYLIIRDVSKRKKMEKELITREQQYKSLLNAIPDLFFVMDINGKYLDYRADKKSPLFVYPKEIIGKSLHDFFDEKTVQNILHKIHLSIEKDELQTVYYSLPSNIGVRNFEARISKMDDDKILSIVRDITGQK